MYAYKGQDPVAAVLKKYTVRWQVSGGAEFADSGGGLSTDKVINEQRVTLFRWGAQKKRKRAG